MTKYVVLRAEMTRDAEPVWQIVGHADASSADRAMREVAAGRTDDGDFYVAVPERSWQPKQRHTEVKEIDRFEQTQL